jgi:predicted dehydrogenase
VGCGKIADAHATQIQRIRGSEIVAVCDLEPLMARQLAERFRISKCFSDLSELLRDSQPDVVHITTPPESHFKIAALCLDHGCHVYVEKPFTLHYPDAEHLIRLAEERKLKLTAGHDGQFGHATRRMRSLIQNGYLGGAPVHMESYYCYELGDSAYVRALLNDKQHWVRHLPGKLLHNIISHGVAKVAEFFTTEFPQVLAHGFVSPFLKNRGESEIIDELRVIVTDNGRTTAYFTFSSQMRPSLHQLRLYGPKNGLIVDQDHETLIKLRGQRFKSYIDQFVQPINFAQQYVTNVATSVRAFLTRDFHMSAGMYHLIESFYRSIEHDTEVPIPYREILLTARIMDDIFAQLTNAQEKSEVRHVAPTFKTVLG